MALWQWSTTPANNASAGAIDWAEGQPPSTVNDSARQMMADVATDLMTDREWIKFGDTPTYVSGTQFTVPNNLTSRYSVGRRVRATVTAGTLYGTITSSAYASLTTVTVAWDTGSLDSGISEVDVGIINPANPSVAQVGSLTLSGNGVSGSLILKSPSYAPSIRSSSSLTRIEFVNNAGNGYMMLLDDSGNLTATGNIGAYSDRRLKTNIEAIDNALARVKKLNGVTYNRKDIEQGVRHMGLIAQDVQRVAPETVRTGPDGYLSVAYGNLMGLLVEAVKELAAEVESLKVAK